MIALNNPTSKIIIYLRNIRIRKEFLRIYELLVSILNSYKKLMRENIYHDEEDIFSHTLIFNHIV